MRAGGSIERRIGRTIAGKYVLKRLLGSGGMGDVYEAEHLYTHRSVALKLIHEAVVTGVCDAAERVFAEATAAASIDHPAVVEVLDAGQDPDSTLYVVFELLHGEDLDTALKRGRVSPLMLVRVCARLLDGLAAAHAGGIVHRDIKPSNIFLAKGPGGGCSVKLIDFGIAVDLHERAAKPRPSTGGDGGTIVGTIEYMSPEQAMGRALDARSDLWAVGAVLFRGLTGRAPFRAENYNRLIRKIATEDAPSVGEFRPELGAALIALVDRALENDREARWESARAMAQAARACDVAQLARIEPPLSELYPFGGQSRTQSLDSAQHHQADTQPAFAA